MTLADREVSDLQPPSHQLLRWKTAQLTCAMGAPQMLELSESLCGCASMAWQDINVAPGDSTAGHDELEQSSNQRHTLSV